MFQTIPQTLAISSCLGAVAAILSLLLTRYLLVILPKLGIVDKPDFKRHIHRVVVPRGGGISMVFSFVAVLLSFFYFFLKTNTKESLEIVKLLSPLLVLVPLGIIDDKRGLHAKIKFIFQIIAAVITWYFDCRLKNFFGLELPDWLSLPFTILWVVGFINAFNMIDGVDGLASGIGIISAICLAVAAISLERYIFFAFLITFCGALLGFLYYNWNPARLFMGDTGSMFIGYILAVSGLYLNARKTSVVSILVPLLACGVPFLDIIFAVWRRIIGPGNCVNDSFTLPIKDKEGAEKNKFFWQRLVSLLGRLGTADQRHLHHRLLNYFQKDQKKTVLNIYSIALMMGLVGIICCYCPSKHMALTLILALGTFSFVINRLAFVELWQTSEVIYHNFQTARTGIIITYFFNPLSDIIILVLAYFNAASTMELATVNLLRYLCIIVGVMVISRQSRILWNFAVSDDYMRLICTLAVGFFLSWFSDIILDTTRQENLHFYAWTIAVTFIMAERLGIHYFRNAQAGRMQKTSEARKASIRTILIGVSPLTRFYRNQVLSDTERAAREEIMGLVDADKHFSHSYCYGMKILGNFGNLSEIVKETEANKLVIMQDISPDALSAIQAIAEQEKLELRHFICKEL